VLSTRAVYDYILTLELAWQDSEKLVQELAWRDYWQQVWIAKGDAIYKDLKHPQTPISNFQIPTAIYEANTGITAIDDAIKELYHTGYMHNHMRMYVASICCNVGHSHWMAPAKWMYAHLLDGDCASNQLSWQWVAGTLSGRKYFANQENINRFFNSAQKNTFLDIDYDEFNTIEIPPVLFPNSSFECENYLPESENPVINAHQTSLIYNYYNLDPSWHEGENVQRILLLEPSVFRKHPVKQKCIDFALDLAQNIPNIKIVVSEFHELEKQFNTNRVIFKEHPLNKHYKGHEEPREWLSSVSGYYPSFFAFWKKCKKELHRAL
jgi:deoxyribodipyrimidine photo-lyase